MAISTAGDLIARALKKIGVIAEGEEVSASQASDGLDSLNSLLSSWGAETLATTAVTEDSHALVAGTNSYTIGNGSTIDTAKPLQVVDAYLRDAGGLDYDISTVDRNVYENYSNKSTTGRPTSIYYDPGVTQQATQTGTIYVYPTPDSATTYTLYISSEKNLVEFASLVSAYTFPAFYKRALIYNLAIDLATDYGRPIPPEVVAIADDSKRVVSNVNARNKHEVAGMPLPMVRGNGNIYSGGI